MAIDDIPDWASLYANSVLYAVKNKDRFTFEHCCRVGRAARRLAKAMSLTDYEQNVLEFSGLFHDIGKVGIPDSVLLKPAKLTKDEVDLMKSHPLKSSEIIEPLSGIPFFRFLLPGVRCHHEKIDGSGYPYGLVGEKIPLPARIIAVVDTVDAMTNVRPYRKALSMDTVKKELLDFSGTQFDPGIVRVYLDALRHWEDIETASPEERVVAAILKKAA